VGSISFDWRVALHVISAAAEATLKEHGVAYGSAQVPNTSPVVTQLFLFDCDGNGVELGNFPEMSGWDPEMKTVV
jgi:hypothetical protein